MKKILLILIVIIPLIFLCSCSNELYNVALQNISEITEVEYHVLNENYFASFSGGKRELPYLVDGKKNEMVSYGLLKIVILNEIFNNLTNVIFTINDVAYNINLKQTDVNTFIGDINYYPTEEATIILNFKLNNNENVNLTLLSIMPNFKISNKKALNIFINTKYNTLKTLINNGMFNAEIHITLLFDIRISKDKIFWYVSFCNDKINYSCCIDVDSGALVVSNF